jgi:hypothetical protein
MLGCSAQHDGRARHTPEAAAPADAGRAQDAGAEVDVTSLPYQGYELVEKPAEGCFWRSTRAFQALREQALCEASDGGTCRSSFECTRPEQCTAQPHGQCHAQTLHQCVYGTVTANVSCSSAADCAHLPGGVCTTPVERCDDLGRCDGPHRHCTAPGLEANCVQDSDCKLLSGGRCDTAVVETGCAYAECTTSSECGPGERCACAGFFFKCVPSECMADGDCSPGQHCRLSAPCIPLADGFYCSTPNDSCGSDADCSDGVENAKCRYDPRAKHWECTYGCFIDPTE